MARALDDKEQIAGLAVVNYLLRLFTGTPREIFTRDEVLVILDGVRSDAEIFAPDVQAVFEVALADELAKEGSEN